MELAILWVAVGALIAGLLLGKWAEERRWRAKGDHPYMNRTESGGRLYNVQRSMRRACNR